jgi:hypothetical protein
VGTQDSVHSSNSAQSGRPSGKALSLGAGLHSKLDTHESERPGVGASVGGERVRKNRPAGNEGQAQGQGRCQGTLCL